MGAALALVGTPGMGAGAEGGNLTRRAHEQRERSVFDEEPDDQTVYDTAQPKARTLVRIGAVLWASLVPRWNPHALLATRLPQFCLQQPVHGLDGYF